MIYPAELKKIRFENLMDELNADRIAIENDLHTADMSYAIGAISRGEWQPAPDGREWRMS